MPIAQLRDIADIMASLVIMLGLPAGLIQYYRAVKREQRDRVYGTYNALDEKYYEFLHICLRHPYLDIYDLPHDTPQPLTEEQKKEELVALTILFSLMERAYIMYTDQDHRIRRAQWTGWDDYIREYMGRENIQVAWRKTGDTFDTSFVNYIEQLLQETAKQPVPVNASATLSDLLAKRDSDGKQTS